MKHICRYGAVAIMLILFLGCTESKPKEDTSQSYIQKKIDRILALPYLGGTKAPKDERTGVLLFDKERTCPGYRLYAVQNLSTAELIDSAGKVLRTWHNKPDERWERAELLPNGDLLVVGMEQNHDIRDSMRYVMRLDWSGRVLWRRKLLAHHDIEMRPDGRLMLLTFKRRLVPDIHPTIETRDDYLTVLEQDGTVVEELSMLEAIRKNPEVFPLKTVNPAKRIRPAWVDLFHSNSVEWMHYQNLFNKNMIYGPDNVLVCFRNQDRIAIFNWPEKKVIWSWGMDQISGPHDAKVLDNGNILLFDNGIGHNYSRAVEVNPITKEIVWEYVGDPPESFYTPSKGSAQRLSNGNTLLADSDHGRAIEVTNEGRIVWEFITPYRLDASKRASIIRMILYPRNFIGNLLPQNK